MDSPAWPLGGAVAIVSPFWGQTFVRESSYVLEIKDEATKENNFVFLKIVLLSRMYKCLGKRKQKCNCEKMLLRFIPTGKRTIE